MVTMEAREQPNNPEGPSPVFRPARERPAPVARFGGGGIGQKHRRKLDGARHLHRLFQVTLGLLMSRHAAVRETCGEPIRWSYSHRHGGGYTFEGPHRKVVIVPTREGAYCLNASAPEMVRAMDATVCLMLDQADESRPAAREGRDGNAIARGWFYLMHGVQEHEYVALYATFMASPLKAAPLGELFDVWRD